jgi:hypothetical protein
MRKRAGTNAQEVHLLRLEELEPVAHFSTSAFQIASFMSFPLYSLITYRWDGPKPGKKRFQLFSTFIVY